MVQRHCPRTPCNVTEVCQPRQPYHIQKHEVLKADFNHSQCHCHCGAVSSVSSAWLTGESTLPGGDWLTALLLSSPECPRNIAGGQMKRTQSRSSISSLGCPSAIFFYLNIVFAMDKLWIAEASNNRTPFWFRTGQPFLPIKSLHVWLLLPRTQVLQSLRTSKRLGIQHCCLTHKHKLYWKTYPWHKDT